MKHNDRTGILRDTYDIISSAIIGHSAYSKKTITSLFVIIKNMQWGGKKNILPPYLVTLMSRSRQYLLKLFDKTTNLLIPQAERFVITLPRNTQSQI